MQHASMMRIEQPFCDLSRCLCGQKGWQLFSNDAPCMSLSYSNSELCQRGRQLQIPGVLVVVFDVHIENEERSRTRKSRQRGRGE